MMSWMGSLVTGPTSGVSPDSGYMLTPLEIAAGQALDFDDQAEALRIDGVSPFDALGQATLPSLRRPPCVVSFSGGVDSSLVLAAAVLAARRHGLPLPIPVTLRYPGLTEAQESDWQELVIRHLAIEDWTRLEITDELDAVGPVAARHLLHHGVLWPPNLHTVVPMIEQADGGSVLTGYGGDHIMRGWPARSAADVLRGRQRPTWCDPFRLALRAVAPEPVRRLRHRRQVLASPWLTERAQRAVRRAVARIRAGEPWRWDRWLQWRVRRRGLVLAQRHFALLASDGGAGIDHPLLDLGFLGALARSGHGLGMGDRGRIVSAIAGEALPPSVAVRRSKATFGSAFWGEKSQRFAAAWEGQGLDPELVKPEALAIEWRYSPGGCRTLAL